MTRYTRGDAEIDRLEMERERKLKELQNPGSQLKPVDDGPKTPLGWIATIIGLACLIGFFLGFYALMRYFLGF